MYPLFLVFFSFFLAHNLFGDKPIVLVVGTRPEAIKVIPVFQALKESYPNTLLCSTGQHAELLDEIFHVFNVTPDYDLKIMKPNQDLFYITKEVLEKTRQVFENINPSLVIVQGDTSTAMSAALAAYYLKIPIAHIEAGLRTNNIYGPFPEEVNRLIISKIAALNFAPTSFASVNLQKEGIDQTKIFITGNTVVDALYSIREKISKKEISNSKHLVDKVDELKKDGKKIILLTAHRRENLGEGLTHIFKAVKNAIEKYPELVFIYPMHPNPAIKKTFDEVFQEMPEQIVLLPPLPYHDLVYLLDIVDGVATDSGGIQEEAISLNKMTLVLRNETERQEGLQTDLALLVGNDESKILDGIGQILIASGKENKDFSSTYGDGFASQKICKIIQNFLTQNNAYAN